MIHDKDPRQHRPSVSVEETIVWTDNVHEYDYGLVNK